MTPGGLGLQLPLLTLGRLRRGFGEVADFGGALSEHGLERSVNELAVLSVVTSEISLALVLRQASSLSLYGLVEVVLHFPHVVVFRFCDQYSVDLGHQLLLVQIALNRVLLLSLLVDIIGLP